MASSVVDICNMALYQVGISQPISALTDQSKAAQVVNAYWDQSRQSVLEEYGWPFAMRRTLLPQLVQTRDDWGYVYSLPTDCIAPRDIVIAGQRVTLPDSRYPYEIELSDDGGSKVFLSDLSAVELRYTADVTAVGLFSALFTEALTWKLASRIAMPMKVDGGLRKQAEDEYTAALSKAIVAALRERQQDPTPDSEFITVRS